MWRGWCWVRVSGWALVALLSAALFGCAGGGLAPVDDRGAGPAPPGFYRIRAGDTLSEIAERKRISMRKLAAWNDLGPPYPLYTGRLLRIEPPPAGQSGSRTRRSSQPRSGNQVAASRAPSKPRSSSDRGAVASAATKPGSAASSSGVSWSWPVAGPVVQGYRSNDRTRQGVRIAAAEGTPVAAAADGEVVYSGSSGLAGYGNLIIVKHNARYLSAYGFNRRVLAAEGASVKRGQPVAEVGQAADGQPMLHFEIRRDGAAVDPLLFLPASR
jgi:lipoprotein NlpD